MIYVNFKPENTVKEFLLQLFKIDPQLPYQIKFVETFLDKECKGQQTGYGRLRSFDDVLEIVQTYFPKCSVEQLFHEILVLELYCKSENLNFARQKNRRLLLQLANCSTIRRIRIYYCIPSYNSLTEQIQLYSGSNLICDKYDSKYSWIDLIEAIGIKYTNELETQKEIMNYIYKYTPYKHLVNEEIVKT